MLNENPVKMAAAKANLRRNVGNVNVVREVSLNKLDGIFNVKPARRRVGLFVGSGLDKQRKRLKKLGNCKGFLLGGGAKA